MLLFDSFSEAFNHPALFTILFFSAFCLAPFSFVCFILQLFLRPFSYQSLFTVGRILSSRTDSLCFKYYCNAFWVFVFCFFVFLFLFLFCSNIIRRTLTWTVVWVSAFCMCEPRFIVSSDELLLSLHRIWLQSNLGAGAKPSTLVVLLFCALHKLDCCHLLKPNWKPQSHWRMSVASYVEGQSEKVTFCSKVYFKKHTT